VTEETQPEPNIPRVTVVPGGIADKVSAAWFAPATVGGVHQRMASTTPELFRSYRIECASELDPAYVTVISPP